MGMSLGKQIRCIKRELELREHVYPRWVKSKRLTQWEADEEIAAMRAVLETLEKLADGGQRSMFDD